MTPHDAIEYDFPASSYEGERLSHMQMVARILIAVILTAVMFGLLSLIGEAEQDSLREHAEWYGELRESGACVL
ncbi:MAG: hypothetical protein IKF14_13870 [Atopobiaceae bacterium]|nr:hypothetical protein [Atopobiaceae bacterium]MBR3160167.1 hypothetical protein [Atopobiaceae bacterium]